MSEISLERASTFALRVRSTSSHVHIRAGRGTLMIALSVATMLALGTFGFLRSLTLDDPPVATAAIDPFARAEAPLITSTPTPAVPSDRRSSATPRREGLNYLVFGTVSSHDEAVRQRTALAKAGVETSVERALPGWSSRGYSLVGVRGFDLPRENTLYASYLQALQAKKLKPAAYKWRAETTIAQR
ncbi:MAG TPA: hypothetical protein PKB10_06055 [Tepidisphaeraceae bacterium]|nr:hypothetical protein [Tepidisphaeraceae bacterium]